MPLYQLAFLSNTLKYNILVKGPCSQVPKPSSNYNCVRQFSVGRQKWQVDEMTSQHFFPANKKFEKNSKNVYLLKTLFSTLKNYNAQQLKLRSNDLTCSTL
jgi:hypothetical protein